MARTPKRVVASGEESNVLPPPVQPTPRPRAEAKVVQTTRREFVENQDDQTSLELDDQVDSEEDELEVFLQQLDQSRGLVVRVERLPRFQANGQSGIRAEREFVCQMPFTREFMLGYESDIQQTYGGGDYQVLLKEGIRNLRMWQVHIAAPPRATSQQPQSQPGTAALPFDPMLAFKQQMTFTREFLAMSKELNPPPVQTSAPGLAPEVAELHGKMAIMEKLLTMPHDNPVVVKALEMVTGSESSAASWAGVVQQGIEWFGTLLEPVLPVAAQIILAKMQPAAVQQPQGPPNPQAQIGPAALPTGPVPVPPESQRIVQRIFARCVQDCANGFDASGVIDDLWNLNNNERLLQVVGNDQQAAGMLSALLNTDPRGMAQRVPGLNSDRGVAWLIQLQADWFAKLNPPPAPAPAPVEVEREGDQVNETDQQSDSGTATENL